MKRVYVIGTGGTISSGGTEGATTNYDTGVFDVRALLQSAAGIERLAVLEGEQFASKASDDITREDWLALCKRINTLAQRPEIDGFVITHGTNTMEETAYFLHLVLKTEKPVVLTGAMRPATALSADGAMNLYQAVALAASPAAAGRGVLAVMADRIYDAAHLHKSNAFRLDAFGGGDAGCLGYMQDDAPCFRQRSECPHTLATPFCADKLQTLPKVEIVWFYADADPALLRYAARHADGLILAGAGAGFASEAWERVLKEITGKLPVVRASRTMAGLTTQDDYDARAGTVPGGAIDPVKARILLMLALTQHPKPTGTELAALFRAYSGV